MDYREEQFFRMQQFDTPKVPFYMSYPMQNLYLTEMEYEKDIIDERVVSKGCCPYYGCDRG